MPVNGTDEIKLINSTYYATCTTDDHQNKYQYIVLGGANRLPLFSDLIQSLCKQDLLLADRYYTSYANIAILTRQGTSLVFRQQSTVKKSDFRRGQRLGAKDHIISVKKTEYDHDI